MENRYKPLISVIIPAYNAQAFIAQTLESVIAQTYSNLEILVVDDGSSDRTAEIIRQFAQQDSRIHLLQQSNAGVAVARNLAIKKARGEFIAPVDADDIWYPHNIAWQLQAMNQGGQSVGLVYSWSVDIDEQDRPTGGFRAAQIAGDVYTTLIAHNFIGNASATMMRRSCLEQVGVYDPGLKEQNAQGCEDWDLYLRIAEHYEFQVVREFSIGYRKISSSMSCDYRVMAKSHNLVMASVQQRHPDLPKYLFKISSSNLYIYFAHQSDRYQRHDITRLWLKEALKADTFTTLIRPGLYRLMLNSTWGLFTSSRSTSKSTFTASSSPVENKTKPYQVPRLTLDLMLAVGDGFHWLITVLFPKVRVSLQKPTSLLMEEKQ